MLGCAESPVPSEEALGTCWVQPCGLTAWSICCRLMQQAQPQVRVHDRC